MKVGLLLVAAAAIFTPAAAASSLFAAPSSVRVSEADAVGVRTNGKIFGTSRHKGYFSCSGTALDTPSRSVVLTAGHCIVEDDARSRNLVFIPAYDHGERPFGTFRVSAVYTMARWRRAENPDFDVAALRVKPNRLGRLGDLVGGRRWVTGRSRFSKFEIFGYPAGALEGEALRSCRTKSLGSDTRTNTFPGPPTVPGSCDMASGASGGAWIVKGGYVNGVTSYGYPRHHSRLYSPYFGAVVGRFLSRLP